MKNSFETPENRAQELIKSILVHAMVAPHPDIARVTALIQKADESDELRNWKEINSITEKCTQCGHSMSPSYIESGWCMSCICKDYKVKLENSESSRKFLSSRINASLAERNTLKADNEKLREDAARYKYIRTLNPRVFCEISERSINYGIPFDDLVDEAIQDANKIP